MLCKVKVRVCVVESKEQDHISKLENLHSSAVLLTTGNVCPAKLETQKAKIPATDIVIATSKTDATNGEIPFTILKLDFV